MTVTCVRLIFGVVNVHGNLCLACRLILRSVKLLKIKAITGISMMISTRVVVLHVFAVLFVFPVLSVFLVILVFEVSFVIRVSLVISELRMC